MTNILFAVSYKMYMAYENTPIRIISVKNNKSGNITLHNIVTGAPEIHPIGFGHYVRDNAKNLIRENDLFQIPSIIQMWSRDWMQLLETDILSFINSWYITEEEWLKYANNPKLITGENEY